MPDLTWSREAPSEAGWYVVLYDLRRHRTPRFSVKRFDVMGSGRTVVRFSGRWTDIKKDWGWSFCGPIPEPRESGDDA